MVRIRFTDRAQTKKRPAIVLTGDPYHASRADAVVVPLTTKRYNSYYGDYDLAEWRGTGLPMPTKAKGTLETIERSTIISRLGTVSALDFEQIKQNVRTILNL